MSLITRKDSDMPKHRNWKKLRPDSSEELEKALYEEKKLTSRWYERISGNAPWGPGEREKINELMDSLSVKISRLIQENAASNFASLPDR